MCSYDHLNQNLGEKSFECQKTENLQFPGVIEYTFTDFISVLAINSSIMEIR